MGIAFREIIKVVGNSEMTGDFHQAAVGELRKMGLIF